MARRGGQFAWLLSGWLIVVLAGVSGAALALALSLLQPLEYSSTTKVLITQELGSTDPYAASRASSIVAEELANIIYTTDIFEKVMTSGYDIDTSYFPENDNKRRAKWEESITASLSRSSNLLAITAYHSDVAQAEELARAVAFVLTNDGWMYTSSTITLRVVDEPLNSRYPVRPNLVVNGVSGLILGLLGGVGYVLIQAERVRRGHAVGN